MLNIKYLTIHKVHMHAGAIRQLMYGCAYVRETIHSLQLVDYPPVHTHKPYTYLLHITYDNGIFQLYTLDVCSVDRFIFRAGNFEHQLNSDIYLQT